MAGYQPSIFKSIAMAVTITCEKIDDGLIHVNGKEVRQDMNGNWIGSDLDIIEANVFRQFLNSMDRSGGIKIQTATYKI